MLKCGTSTGVMMQSKQALEKKSESSKDKGRYTCSFSNFFKESEIFNGMKNLRNSGPINYLYFKF